MVQNEALKKREVPSLYFVGVSTLHSSIMKVFPVWSDLLGLGADIVGYDIALDAPDEDYRTIVNHIKSDPLAMGALVTTHKINLLNATRDIFDYLDPYAEICGEISCISKQETELQGYAKDPISSGLTWKNFILSGHFSGDSAVLCLGAGGAAVAISVFLARLESPDDRPAKFIAVDISEQRIDHLKAIHASMDTDIEFDYVLNRHAEVNDELVERLPNGSVVINATGMGKDRPGSPITDNAIFPMDGYVWELNYRGERQFLVQAQNQVDARRLVIEDGWVYFLHGWSQVIAEVFKIELTDEIFQQMDSAASVLRPQ